MGHTAAKLDFESGEGQDKNTRSSGHPESQSVHLNLDSGSQKMLEYKGIVLQRVLCTGGGGYSGFSQRACV